MIPYDPHCACCRAGQLHTQRMHDKLLGVFEAEAADWATQLTAALRKPRTAPPAPQPSPTVAKAREAWQERYQQGADATIW